MPYKWNPLSGKLDYYTDVAVNFSKLYKTVDAAFLLNKELTLAVDPLTDSEFVFLNGLVLRDDCYNISGNTLTFDPTLPFKIGHEIDVRYAT